MALPKAVLCILGHEPADHPVEAALRAGGFATFSITWKELDSHPNGWIQILPPLDDPAVVAWVVAGKPADFTDAVRSKIALLTLAMTRKEPPATAFVLTEEGEMRDVPHAMSHVRIYTHAQKYAAKLMVAKVKPQPAAPLPFHLKAHLDPFIGAWLEAGPPDGEERDGFMFGVTQAAVTAFGVGPRGVVPTKSTLRYPMLGIEGTIGDAPFNACAAMDTLSPETSCYMRLDGTPGLLLCTDYPNEDTGRKNERHPLRIELV